MRARHLWWTRLAGSKSGASVIMGILKLAPASTFVAVAGLNPTVTPSGPDITQINRLYVDTTAGNAIFDTIVDGADGQLLWIWNQGPNTLTLQVGGLIIGSDNLRLLANDQLLLFYDLGQTAWISGV